MKLREVVDKLKDEQWYIDHKTDIDYEVNHLELHDLDLYLMHIYNNNIKVSNPNNSNVAYLIGVTEEEPTGRIATTGGSFPDIDIDFAHDYRDRVVNHLREVYGNEHVSGIGTFMVSKARGIFKDTARIFDLSFLRSNEISKMIPDRPDLVSLSEALAESPELKKVYDTDPEIKKIIDYAQNLEGTVRSVGMHACGFVIGTEPLHQLVPLFESKGNTVTQFDGPSLENIGLIKFDILGLKNLTVMQKSVVMIQETKGITIDLDTLSFDDPKAYDLISEGNSLGVFQIEGSKGLRDFAAMCKPSCLNDLSAIISLYRPGPMGMGYLEEYIKRKAQSAEENRFIFQDYDYIFQDTQGLMIYQEQLMRLAADMSGFNDIKVDVLRKAVGKKDAALLESLRDDFISGAVLHGIDEDELNKLWEQMREFGRYAFNKSHAICYADIGYKTAWLKAYYPSEYMASLISCENDPEQQSIYMADAKRNGVDVMPPDLNISKRDFAIGNNGEILFGYSQIKGLGVRVVDKILSIKPFDSFGDFLIKAYHAKGINKKVIGILVTCGACDTFGYNRSGMLAGFEKYITDYASALKRDEEEIATKAFIKDQDTYFNLDIGEIPVTKILEYEKDLLGVHISGNPFELFATLVKEDVQTISSIIEEGAGCHYILGQINKIKRLKTKKDNKAMAFIDVSDISGVNTSFILFPQQYEKYSELLSENKFILIFCNVKKDNRGTSLLVATIRDLSSEIDSVSDKIEAEKRISNIDIHITGNPGIVRMRTLQKHIEQYTTEDKGCSATLIQNIGNLKLVLNVYNISKIDIPMLRGFSKFDFVYVNRSLNG